MRPRRPGLLSAPRFRFIFLVGGGLRPPPHLGGFMAIVSHPVKSVSDVLADLLSRFESKDFPACVAHAVFPALDVPCSAWSLGNRVLMVMAGTGDARGYRQWEEVGRFVKKGCHAFRILVPRFGKKAAADSPTGEDEVFISGFLTAPVFRVEDTDGEPLEYQSLQVPDFPLYEVAHDLGLSVKAVPGNDKCYGYFRPSTGEIALASEDEIVFFHELAHAVHYRVCPDVAAGEGQRVRKEIVAELSAAALCVLVGRDGSKFLGNSYHYIASYAAKSKKSPVAACFQVLADVDKVLRFLCGCCAPAVDSPSVSAASPMAPAALVSA